MCDVLIPDATNSGSVRSQGAGASSEINEPGLYFFLTLIRMLCSSNRKSAYPKMNS